MPIEPDYLEFTTDHLGPVVACMAAQAEAHRGWINFEPEINTDDLPPPRSGLAGLLSGRGPDVPVTTWTPGEARKGRPEPPSVGIQHAAGPGAAGRLEAARRPVPKGWVVVQDHSRRGLVVAVPPAVDHLEVLDWLLSAAGVLSAVPLGRRWRAAIYAG
jgi:hypothetical protein